MQVVGSMNPATTVGRQPLAPRLAALMHVAFMGYPAPAHLQSVLSTTLASTLNKVCQCCARPARMRVMLLSISNEELVPCSWQQVC